MSPEQLEKGVARNHISTFQDIDRTARKVETDLPPDEGPKSEESAQKVESEDCLAHPLHFQNLNQKMVTEPTSRNSEQRVLCEMTPYQK